ncbi:MAG: sigma-70 family RNA polymerase sigma factor [Rikenellaceae bacterium]
MAIKIGIENSEEAFLLKKFNERDRDAFGRVYMLFYKELYYYASSIYQNTVVEADDVVQDVFFNIWKSKNRKFDRLEGIKAYLFVSIKNNYKNFYAHNKLTNRLTKAFADEDELFIVQAVESEIFSIVPSVLNKLPEECARSFKMFLEGWDIKDIADKLEKKSSTIYNQRKESISILKKYFSVND